MKKHLMAALMLGLALPNGLMAQTENSGRNEVYTATTQKKFELLHTKLKVSFSFEKEELYGEEFLKAKPFFYAENKLELDAKSMEIQEVALLNGSAKTPLKFDYQNREKLIIDLGKSYARGQEFEIYIKYTAQPSQNIQKGSAAIKDAKGLYFINPTGKKEGPTQIWTQGETESSSCWFPTIDKPNQKSTEEIYITVPEKYNTLSNGLMKSSTKQANGLRTDHWVFDKQHAPYLFFMGIGEFSIVKDKWKNIDVDYYVEKKYEPVARTIFGDTPAMIEFFSKKLNYQYPWQKYSQMVGRDYVSGAMENTTSVIHQESAYQEADELVDENKWESVIAHELFHHWFGDLVTAESWSNLTVNESFANYSEYLWFEHKYGKAEADYHLYEDIQGYKRNPENYNKDLARFNYHSREDMFDAVSYNKGGSILHMLRNYLGDEAFFESINQYLKSNAYGTGEAHQLRLAFEQVSGKDLNWFFNQWYFGSGHPKIKTKDSYDAAKKQVKIELAQGDKLFEFPLEIDIASNGQVKRHKVWVNAKSSQEIVLEASAKPDYINLNPTGVIISDIEQQHSLAQKALIMAQSQDIVSQLEVLEQAKEEKTDHATLAKIYAQALKNPSFRIRQMALEQMDLKKEDISKLALATVEKLASTDPKTLVQAAALEALAALNDKKYLPVFEKATSSNSAAVKSAAMGAVIGLDPSKAELYLDKINIERLGDNSKEAIVNLVVDKKIEKQLPNLAKDAIIYPFIKRQNPGYGAGLEKTFEWMMTSDQPAANKKACDFLKLIQSQIKGQAKVIVLDVLRRAITLKTGALAAQPNSESLKTQVEELKKTQEIFYK